MKTDNFLKNIVRDLKNHQYHIRFGESTYYGSALISTLSSLKFEVGISTPRDLVEKANEYYLGSHIGHNEEKLLEIAQDIKASIENSFEEYITYSTKELLIRGKNYEHDPEREFSSDEIRGLIEQYSKEHADLKNKSTAEFKEDLDQLCKIVRKADKIKAQEQIERSIESGAAARWN